MAKIQHVVLLKFRADVDEATVTDRFDQLARLRNRIEGIEHFSGGPYSSHEGLNAGYTHGFVMTFTDAAARDAYLPHPEHEKVKDAILPCVESVIAFDYELRE